VSTARSSLLMASGTIVSRILGFVRAVLLAVTIGVTTNAADAFGIANQLPNNVYAIIAGGVLNAVLVPQIIKARAHKDGGQSYINRLVTLIISGFTIVTVVTTLAAPFLVSIYTTGWSADQLALATAFAYWCLPQLFFYGLYSLFGEILNARSAFGPYMWAPVLNNLVAIAGMLGFILLFGADPTGHRAISDWGGSQVTLLAGTATAGVASQALILLVFWKRIGLKFRLNFGWRGVGLRPAAKAASWTLGMVLITQLGGLVQSIVASSTIAARVTQQASGTGLAVASVAAASIGWLVFMLPHSIATVSIATASFTKISQHAQDGKIDDLKRDLGGSLRAILAISALSTAALIVLAYPIARVFVGEYEATIALGNVIMAMMVGLVPFSFVFMLQRAFYALEDTRTPFFFTLAQISVFVVGAVIIAQTVPAVWLVAALSLLNSVSITVQAVLAYRLLRRRIGRFEGIGLAGAAARMIASALIAAAAGWSYLHFTGLIDQGGFGLGTVVGAVLTCIPAGLIMLVVYFVVLALLGVEETWKAWQGVAKAFKGIVRR
jgi:putative peptidoglycan lipid II flippase